MMYHSNREIEKIKNKVLETIRAHSLYQKGDTLLIALSGGADSCCLLHLLNSLKDDYKWTIYVAHLNHQLREDADDDQKYCERYCKQLDIPFFAKKVDINRYAIENHISLEQAGRQARYDFFEELKQKHNIQKLATAHNQNDVAETIVMNIIRGSGLSGMSGIPYERDGFVTRPLLDTSRNEIEQYCQYYNIDYVTDSTNLLPIYTRNQIRLNVIPYIEENFNPNFITRITQNAKVIARDNDFILQYSKSRYQSLKNDSADGGVRISLMDLKKEHDGICYRVIQQALKDITGGIYNIESEKIERIISLIQKGETGKSYLGIDGIEVKIEYNDLVIQKQQEKIGEYAYLLRIGEEVEVFQAQMKIQATLCESAKENTKTTIYIKNPIGELQIRNRRNGDFFYPSGMNGKKKLKNYFIDGKIPIEYRNIVPIVTVGENIVWIVGMRADDRFLANEGEACIRLSMVEYKSVL